jgi:hypothetical protein
MMPSHGNWVGMDLGISWENGNRTGFPPRSHSVELAALQGDRTWAFQTRPQPQLRTHDLYASVVSAAFRGANLIYAIG